MTDVLCMCVAYVLSDYTHYGKEILFVLMYPIYKYAFYKTKLSQKMYCVCQLYIKYWRKYTNAPSYAIANVLLDYIAYMKVYNTYFGPISWLSHLYYIFKYTKCDYKSHPFMHFQSSAKVTLWRISWVTNTYTLLTNEPFLNAYVPFYCFHSDFISNYYPLPRSRIDTICACLFDIFIILNWINYWISNTRTLLTKVFSFIISVVYYCNFCNHILMSDIISYPCFIYCCSLIIFCTVFAFNFLYLKTFLECWSNEIIRYLLKYIINKLFNISLIYFSNVS